MMSELHPFAKFIAILGRGKTLSRSLTLEEADEAMGMIIDGIALPEQLGAFLMLQRFQEETPEEVAGFVKAIKSRLDLPAVKPKVDIDWSSYAGKRRQLPWFVLSALLLSQNGVRVFMHGTEGHTPGRVYTRETLEALGYPVTETLEEAAQALDARNFAYVPLEGLSPKMRDLIELRPIFGLRTPVHTISRMINPFDAPTMLQGIFHRGFLETHTHAGKYLGQPNMAVFRGEGGEIERRANKPTDVQVLRDGDISMERWPRLTADPRQPVDEEMDVQRLAALWRGEIEDEYGQASVTGTLAIALKLLGKADSIEDADKLAVTMWQSRDTAYFAKVA